MKQQIIIVTRDAQLRVALERICSDHGCQVESVDTVDAALKTSALLPVSVMIADALIETADDGINLAISIHRQYPDATCFLIIDSDITEALNSSKLNEHWLKLIHKPFPMLSFAADIVSAISNTKE